ncbi:MAG: hypothetical protein HYS08_00505 [Chlamydiae bacterium]|nr:hypothetical protein [Chlamydiota bacterium]
MGLLAPLNERSFEQTLRVWRQARGMAALIKLQEEARRKGLNRLSKTQIEGWIQQVRRGRRHPSP